MKKPQSKTETAMAEAEAKAPGTVWVVRKYVRAHIQKCPNILVLFGDNIVEAGLGGQAKECRGEPNVLGIPTKVLPSRGPEAYFSDMDVGDAYSLIKARFQQARAFLRDGNDVAFPFMGLGTGRAMLGVKAPKIAAIIHEECGYMMAEARQRIEVPNLLTVWLGKGVGMI